MGAEGQRHRKYHRQNIETDRGTHTAVVALEAGGMVILFIPSNGVAGRRLVACLANDTYVYIH